VLAYVHALVGRTAPARAALAELAADDFGALPEDGIWLGALALLAEVAAVVGDPGAAASLYDRLLPYADRNVPLGWVSSCAGSAARPLALAADALGRTAAAVAHFESAMAANARMGARPWRARTQLDYARLLRRQERREDARALLAEARAEAHALGMPVLVREIDLVRATAG
jgi:hypothetical protein